MKVWFITGCSRGFGKELVKELLNNTEHYVVATARNLSSLQDIATQYPNRVLALKLDVTNQLEIQSAVEQTIEKFGKIDVLVNNAGYGVAGAVEEFSMQEIRGIFETNVFGLMFITKAVLPIMRMQRSGHIMNISSTSGLTAAAGAGLYSSTKFAVEGFSESLHAEVAHFGIKVSIIEPGPFRTEFAGSVELAEQIDEYKDTPAAQIRDYLSQINGKQAGDPVKAAQIMVQVSNMENPPLRLLLGNIAVERILEARQKQLEEFLRYESLTRSADFNEESQA